MEEEGANLVTLQYWISFQLEQILVLRSHWRPSYWSPGLQIRARIDAPVYLSPSLVHLLGMVLVSAAAEASLSSISSVVAVVLPILIAMVKWVTTALSCSCTSAGPWACTPPGSDLALSAAADSVYK